jgi:hypothetical protein
VVIAIEGYRGSIIARGSMIKHVIESNNPLFFTVLIELIAAVALTANNNK